MQALLCVTPVLGTTPPLGEVQSATTWRRASFLGDCPHCGEQDAQRRAGEAGDTMQAITVDIGLITIYTCPDSDCDQDFRAR